MKLANFVDRTDGGTFLTLLTISSLIALIPAVPAAAQAIQTPPRHDSKTPTGVSFRSGSFSIEEQDLSIGGGMPTGLSLARSYNSSTDGVSDPYSAAVGWTHSLNIYVSSQPLPQAPDFMPPPNYRGRCVYNVTGGSGSTGFVNLAPIGPLQTGCGGAIAGPYVPITSSGGKLEYITTVTPNFYRYTGADGSVINFTPSGGGRARDWSMPDGTRLQFTYVAGGIKSVFNNRGWGILFESATKACAVNLAQTYITATSACPADAQTVTYSYSPGTYVSTWRLMTGATKGGSTRTYGYASNDHVNCIKDPGQTTCRIQNSYSHCPEDPSNPYKQPSVRLKDAVISQQDASGRSYNYSYSADGCPLWGSNAEGDYRSFSTVTTTITETGVPGSTVAITDTSSQLIALTDPLGRTSQFGYAGSLDYDYETGEPMEATQPEGNSEWVERDSRGNIVRKVSTAKPGSGLPDISVTALYPASCANIVTCNKPTQTVDAKSNATDYTYDAVHGGVLTETLPADANGIRAVKRNSYVQRSAWLKTSGGGYAPSPDPVWLLAETRSCRTTATVGSACAGGAADEVVTSFDYGPNAGPNNLLLRGQVVSAGGVSLRSCYGYDRDGRKISETQPGANLTSCP